MRSQDDMHRRKMIFRYIIFALFTLCCISLTDFSELFTPWRFANFYCSGKRNNNTFRCISKIFTTNWKMVSECHYNQVVLGSKMMNVDISFPWFHSLWFSNVTKITILTKCRIQNISCQSRSNHFRSTFPRL